MICETCAPPVTDPVLFWVAALIGLVILVGLAVTVIHQRHVHKIVMDKLDAHHTQLRNRLDRP